MRWLIWLPLLALCGAAALLGLRFGMQVAALTETEVIEAYADAYLAARAEAGTAEGARREDCQAAPGAARVWLIVSCGPRPFDATRHYEYRISRTGRLIESRGPETWQAEDASGA